MAEHGREEMTRIYPLIVCGGVGTRLWPVSRTQSPKQFARVGDENSPTFFQSAVHRHTGPAYHAPVIVSAAKNRETLARQMDEIRCTGTVIHEPMGRNTGPAVLAAAMTLVARDPDAVMVVVPADHVIKGDLTPTITAMLPAAQAGRIITFGIKPRYAETGFGYITDGGPVIGYPGLRKVERFVEKPPTRKARLLVESDIAYWASGLSMFAAATIIAEYRKFDPATVDAVQAAVDNGRQAFDGFELSADHFAQAKSGPTESVVFEKTDRISLAPLDVEWSDVGSWSAMYGISESGPLGNVLQGDVIVVETTNSMVRSSSRLVTVVGMKDVIVIDTPDALLVTRVGHCQDVKKVAEHLKGDNRPEAERHVPALPKVSARAYGAFSPVYQSQGVELSSARLAPGGTLDLSPGEARELAVGRGTLLATAAGQPRPLTPGARMVLPADAAVTLVNTGLEEAEVVLMTLHAAAAWQDDAAAAPNVETAALRPVSALRA
jgi:mannose-1-phosphate guanylyltransferase/mannose-6-phosphate isomerase